MLDNIKSLLTLAITAPSGDNCQPWRFAADDTQIDLYNDPEADTSYYNYLQRASLVSHGAVLENIAIAAPSLGIRPVFEIFPDSGNPDHIAKISLEVTPQLDVELAPYIESRTTNRKKYSGGPLNDTQIDELIADGADLPKVTTFLTTSKADLNVLSNVICLSDRLVFENRLLHDFLFEHMRWSDEEAVRCRDGLDIKTLELNAMDAIGFKLLKSWSFANFAGKFGVAKVVAGNARKLAESASAIGLILGQASSDPITYLEGGRLMQRIWLQATKMGLGFHPMTGISFLMQRVAEQHTNGMSSNHVRLIQGVNKTVASVIKVEAPVVIGIFRVGITSPPSAKSLRKDLTAFIT